MVTPYPSRDGSAEELHGDPAVGSLSKVWTRRSHKYSIVKFYLRSQIHP